MVPPALLVVVAVVVHYTNSNRINRRGSKHYA
jgi:hypothetical protein